MDNNILLQHFETPFAAPPFSKITLGLFPEAIEKAIQEQELEVEQIISNSAKPNFENTLVALENSGKKLNEISTLFFNLNSAHTSPEMQKMAQELSEKLTNHSNNIAFNERLFERIKTVYNLENEILSKREDQLLLEETYKQFVRNGALLNAEQKAILGEINNKLAQLSLTFSEHVLAETNAYSLEIKKSELEKIAGLPNYILSAAEEEAKERNLEESYVFTLQAPSYLGLMTFAENRTIRKEIFIAFATRCFKDNEFNNESVIKEIVTLRAQKAKLLGYKSFADFVLENRMIQSTEKLSEFIFTLRDKAEPFAKADLKLLEEYSTKLGYKKLEPWDRLFLEEKLKTEKFKFDESTLKPYFKLENVINGAFIIAQKLFDIRFEENKEIEVYHKDVKAYQVKNESGETIALFYTDFYPRASKRGGAWMTSYRGAHIRHNKKTIPLISIVCNFTKPTNETPSLLTFDEVKTLFHEFGHALHGMLGKGTYESQTGTNVTWDFVELPSQLMENWCLEKESLDFFAKHYQTDEPIPSELIDKIKAAANFFEGYNMFRQLSFGYLDFCWHTQNADIDSVKNFEKEATKSFELIETEVESCSSTAFSHIFAGGYAAGYYSYKWAEVLEADIFESFKEKGIFNKGVAEKYKLEILEKGGTEKPEILFRNFKGRDPKVEPLLKKLGN
ncbi:MAG: M3 family metallopeptidase [Luteibaculaceae bacterium]